MNAPTDNKIYVHADGGIPHDALNKSYFAKVRAVQDLIVDFVPRVMPDAAAWIERIDFSTFEQLPTETIDKTLQSRFNDMVWRFRLRAAPGQDAEWMYVIVMVEFQSSVDWFMALRIQSYAVRIYESLPVCNRPNSKSRLPPILAMVVYNGKSPWGAALRLSGLVGPGTRPAEPSGAVAPTFTGESYLLFDMQQLAGEDLPPDNVVSLLAKAHGMQDVQDVARVWAEAWRLLRGPQREELRDVFRLWLGMLARQIGVDLKSLEDEIMSEQPESESEVRLLVEERLQAQLDRMKAQSREVGREEGREVGREEGRVEGRENGARDALRLVAAQRFGADTARHLDPLLAAIKDPERLSSVCRWIADCTTGPELLERLRNAH